MLISLVIFFTICSRSWALPACGGSPATWEGLEKVLTWDNCIGIFTYVSDDIYEGEWKKGMKHGQGTYIFYDGRIMKGVWENDVIIKNLTQSEREYKEQFRVAGKACEDLGFEKGTESFGQCVLDLTE